MQWHGWVLFSTRATVNTSHSSLCECCFAEATSVDFEDRNIPHTIRDFLIASSQEIAQTDRFLHPDLYCAQTTLKLKNRAKLVTIREIRSVNSQYRTRRHPSSSNLPNTLTMPRSLRPQFFYKQHYFIKVELRFALCLHALLV